MSDSLGSRVVSGPQVDKDVQLMGTQNGPVSHYVVKIVDNDCHK